MNEKEFTYVIDGKTYVQRPLVLGQIKQLVSILENMSVDIFVNEMEMTKLLISNAGPAIAVILTEEGTSPKDKDVQYLAGELEFAIDAETITRVIQDFFACNPVALICEKVAGMVKTVQRTMETGSTGSVSSSREGISQSGSRSSGDTPPESVSPGSSTGQGT